ncbi:hypothetical protein [Actinomadura parmotrematis]|uniref:Uncharacterized protein n=1 Tax=Actinomadura parmotrematis TaxID=2864039 RepID=A0ABS7FNK9_9ACTN|nr:hypothetical protein [Actinomadura parmotrematis]MBW8481901.1 hypothetical protein [Actinomadura parmotrematis]
MAISKELQDKVAALLFEQAEKVHWPSLSLQQRTEMYNQWVQDPQIGGRLTEFMPVEQARVWIKDGPMKEFARARFGIGGFAKHVPNPSAAVTDLITSALGNDWEADMDTMAIKPLRLRVYSEEGEEAIFAWVDDYNHFKHLVWAALKEQADGASTPWILCVAATFEKPVPEDVKAFHLRVGRRCGLQVVHVKGV